jgi:hypothetical protein
VYNGTTWVNEGLLIESEARSNLVTYSVPTGTHWQQTGLKTGASIVPDAATAPDGTTSATRITVDAIDEFHFANPAVVPSMGAAPHTVSCFLKADTVNTASLFLSQSGNHGAVFSLTGSGSVTSVTGAGNTAEISEAGNGWYRCSVTNDGGADLVDQLRIGVANGALSNYVGNDTDSILVWGFQLEAGSTPSSYMPTNGGTYTRTAQSLEVPAHWYDADNPTPTGPELVTNGGFATDTDWIKGVD